jgi:hypothetical protein
MAEERERKRRAHYCYRQGYALFQTNRFLDYMLDASEEEKQWWATKFLQTVRDVNWQWCIEGVCLELLEGNVVLFSVSRYEIPTLENLYMDIVFNPWLQKSELNTYHEGATIDFWILVISKMTDVVDVISCSSICKKAYKAARMDIVYEPWIRRRLSISHPGLLNPFARLPLWQQFLGLSGVYKEQWADWMENRPEVLFYTIATMGGWGYPPIPEGAVFDAARGRIFYKDGVTLFAHHEFGDAFRYATHPHSRTSTHARLYHITLS